MKSSPSQRFLTGSLACFALVLSASLSAAPVINEILYRPGTGYPENTDLEFIEIHNPDTAAVDMSGWGITTGADYTFPSGTSIPAGGYLIVSPNPSALQAATGLSGVLGPWKTGSSLSNSGESITLCNASGTVIDKVTYADEGDWATRTRDSLGGWSWVCAANSAGHSMERQNPKLTRNTGQNWATSSVVGGSPGAANAMLSADVAPLITEVRHTPAVPKSTDTVTISCRLEDEKAANELSATLWWRNATSTSPGGFASVAMTHQGGGYFTATLGALADKQIVEFYVQASDGSLSRTWPAPTSESQNANCSYQVDNEDTSTSTAAYYRLVLTAAENAAFASYTSGNSIGDRMFNVTLVATKGDDATIRYRTSMRVRGNSSRQYTIKPLRISMPTDDRWDDISDFNINPRGAPVAYLANRIQQAAGLVAADAIPVEVRRQGIEYTVSTGSTADYGRLLRVEEINGDYVDNHFPEAVSAQVYRKTSTSSWSYANTTAPSNPDTTWSGWSKQNKSGANDWSDVMNFSKVWQQVAASHFTGASTGNIATGTWNGVAFTDTEVATLSTVADLDYMARWLAVMTIIANNEPNLSTGEDDDYAAAFVNDGTNTHMVLCPHDMDTTFGLGEQTYSATSLGLYDVTENDPVSRAGVQMQIMKPLQPLLGDSTRPGNAAFRAKYLTAIRELFGTVFDADTTANSYPPFHQFVDQHLDYATSTVRTTIKTWMTQRQTYLLGLIGGAKITPSTATSTGTYTTPTSPAIRINEVLASNTATLANGSTYPDTVELHNTGSTAVDLGGMSLTDDTATPTKYVIPAGTTIPAGGYLLFYADSATSEAGLHTGFGLDAQGDKICLYDTSANGGALIDAVHFGLQIADKSLARSAADPTIWGLATPTLGSANGTLLALGSPATLKINEWCGSRLFRVSDDFVELYNPGSSPVALGELRLTDDLYNYPTQYTIPSLSYIEAKGFLALNSDQFDFGLDGDFDYIFLVGANGTLIDKVDLIAQPADHSTGRSTDGGDTWADFTIPTPGLSNATSVPAAYTTLLSGLRVSELMYASAGGNDYDYIELTNIGATTLDLSGVRFTNGIDYTFAAGATLAPGAVTVVCKKRSTFLARYPGATALLATTNYTGNLANEGERVTLCLPSPFELAILNFTYDPTWYATVATGASLCVRTPASSKPALLSEPLTWNASLNQLGSPGTLLAPTLDASLALNAIVGTALSYTLPASNIPVSFTTSSLPGPLALNATTGVLSGTPADAGTHSLLVSALNGNGSASATLTLSIGPSLTLGSATAISKEAGNGTDMTATASGGATEVTLQWQRLVEGVWVDIEGATSATYRLATAQVYQAGQYRLVATAGGLSTISPIITLTVSVPVGSDARFVNLSTRAQCLTGLKNIVTGFVLKGTASRELLLRSVGPSLADHGVSGVLADPVMVLKRYNESLADYEAAGGNDNWGGAENADAMASSFASTGAFSIARTSADAGMHLALSPGMYTVLTNGNAETTGVAIAEIYDDGDANNETRLVNISTRGPVGTGDNIMAAGFVIDGTQSRTVLLRAVGPTLANYSVSDVLADPTMSLYRIVDGVPELILGNDNWEEAENADSVAATAASVKAFALPSGSKDAVILATLAPGTYTIEVKGVAGTSGIALAEIYEVE